MNNFDDLFEQQPQPEATEKPEPQKEKPKNSGGRSARKSSARKPTPPWTGCSARFPKGTAT